MSAYHLTRESVGYSRIGVDAWSGPIHKTSSLQDLSNGRGWGGGGRGAFQQIAEIFLTSLKKGYFKPISKDLLNNFLNVSLLHNLQNIAKKLTRIYRQFLTCSSINLRIDIPNK